MSQGGTGNPESGSKQPTSQPSKRSSGSAKVSTAESGKASAPQGAVQAKPSSGSTRAVGSQQRGPSGSGPRPDQVGKSGTPAQLQLGSYRIVERIGSGGMGTIYRAVHVELDREVALKVLPTEMNSNPTMVARFKREARAAAQLQHENIVQIYDVKEDKGRNFLALEFVRGQDLSDLITAKKHLPIKQAIEILKQAARALDHAFQKGIVHRDIKPSNFLITREGKVKLCDMGLALRIDAGEESKVTRDGTTVGTVDYMSPEQARDSRLADTRSDIYSLGCTLYEMLTGRVPFDEGSVPEKLFKHNQEPIPDPLQFNVEIPDQVLYVLNRMLEKKPDDRYQTPKELLGDLEQLDLDEPKTAAAMRTLAIGTEEDDAEELVLQRPGGRLSMKRQQEAAARQAQLQKIMLYAGGGTAAFVAIALTLWLVFRPSPKPDELATATEGKTNTRNSGSATTSAPPIAKGTAVPIPAAASNSPRPITTTGNMTANPPSSEKERSDDSVLPKRLPVSGETKTATTSNSPAAVEAMAERVSSVDREKIAQELFPPWPTIAIPGAPVKLARGVQEERGGVFATFEAACRSAQSGSCRINIEDTGPLFQRSFSVYKANLETRPVSTERQQNAWRPIVVYDSLAKKGDTYFLQAKNSNLVIEGIDFVVNADDLKESIGLNPFALFDIQGGDLVLRNCTFTILGKHAMPVSLVKFHGLRDPDPTRQPERLARLTFDGCFARGEPLTALTLASGLADVKIIDSLFVGGQMATMLELLPPSDRTARAERTVRLIRSSFVTRGDFLFMDGSSGGDVPTNFKLLDTVIACAASSSARKLVKFKAWPDQSGVIAKAAWDERSSLYTGWGDNLIYSVPPGKLVAKTADTWLQRWGLQPGDSQVRADPWPKEDLGDLASVTSANFGASEVSSGIQSRWGAPSIGCNVDQLPSVSPMLNERTFGRVNTVPLLAIEQLLPSFTYNGQKNWLLSGWQGEQNRRRKAVTGTLKEDDQLDPVLELAFQAGPGADLGKFIMTQPELPVTTIVKVTGTGTHKMSPIRLAGKKSLVILVQQTRGQSPIVLTPTEVSEPAEALIEIRDGDLIVEGAILAWPPAAPSGLPRRFIKVHHGNLTLSGCRLFGPLQGDTGFEAISFTGATQQAKWPGTPSQPIHLDFHPAPHARVNVCQLLDCYVGAESRCFACFGSETVLKLSNCMVVTPGTVASFDELDSAGAAKFEADVIIEQSTLAASKCFFDVGEWISPILPNRPMSFSTRDSLFCDPFDVAAGAAGRSRANILLRYGGRTLQQGLLSWHSENDAFSYDIHGYIQRRGSAANPRQEFDQHWQSVWGRLHTKNPLVDGKNIDKIRLVGKPTANAAPKLKDFERDKKLSDLALQDQCEATKKASHGGRVGADTKRLGL